MKIVRCLRLPDELDAILMDFVRNSDDRLRQSIETAPKAGQSAEKLAETLSLNWSAFASKQFPKEVQAKEMPSLFINAPKTTKKPSGTTVYAFRHPAKVDEFQKYQAEMQGQWRAFFNKQGVEVDEEAFYRLTGIVGLKQMSGTLAATSAPEQALLSVVEEISGRIANAPKGAQMTALPTFSTDPATDMLLSKYVAETYGNFASYLRGRYGDESIAGVDAIISLLEQARGEYLNRTLTHLTGIQPNRTQIANPTQITVAQVRDFLAGQASLPRSETEALAKRLSEYFGEADGLSSPDVSLLQVHLLDVISSPPNAMKGIGEAEGVNHIRSAVYRAWRIPYSAPNRKEKVSAIVEDLFNKRIPTDTPEPLRRWLQQHGWAEAKPSAPKVESAVEKPKPKPEPAVAEQAKPTPAPAAMDEMAQAVEQTKQAEPTPPTRVEGFPFAERWEPQRANRAMIELEQALSSVPSNRATAVIKRVFATTTTTASPTEHFQELLGRMKASEKMLSNSFFKEGVADLPPAVREAIDDWLLSLRRFGDEVEGVADADRAEFVRIVDGYRSALKQAEPSSVPTSAVDDAITQIAEPAPAPTNPTPPPAKPTPEPVASAEPATPPPSEPTPTAPAPTEPTPPTPPTPPPSVAGEPLELPQGIEFGRFPETLRAIMQEYGLPTIRGAKPEYGKMEQIISKYFETNGSFSSIKNTVLTALDEMVSVGGVNAWRGITKNSRFLTIEDGRGVLRSDFQEHLAAQINALRQAEPLLHFINDDHIAGFLLLEDAIKALAVSDL